MRASNSRKCSYSSHSSLHYWRGCSDSTRSNSAHGGVSRVRSRRPSSAATYPRGGASPRLPRLYKRYDRGGTLTRTPGPQYSVVSRGWDSFQSEERAGAAEQTLRFIFTGFSWARTVSRAGASWGMRSWLLCLSLLLVVLADRSFASPYFDDGGES